METTKHFKNLDAHVQNIIKSSEGKQIKGIHFVEFANRSDIYEITNENIILKVASERARRDSDAEALIDLEGIEYFPRLYAYEEKKYLFMEKAQGINLVDFIQSGCSEDELDEIKTLILDAFGKMLDRERMDNDFKLEHIFWSKENNKLTWIDLGICDKYPLELQNKTNELTEFEQHLDEQIDQQLYLVRN